MEVKTSPRVWTVTLIAIFAVTVWFLLPQLGVVVFTALMAFVFYPLYKRLKRKKGGVAATITLLASFLVVLLPLAFVTVATISQLAGLAETTSHTQYWERMPGFAEKAIGVVNDILMPITGQRPSLTDQNVIDFLRTALPAIARNSANILLNILSSLPGLAVSLIIYIFLFIEFLLKGPQFIAKAEALSPFERRVTEQYIEKIGLMAKAMVTGQLIIAMILAVVAAALLIPLGYGHYFFIFFIIFTILNFMPLGSGFILIPLAIYSMFTGQFWMGLIVIFLYSISGNFDPVLRSKLIPDKIQLSVGLTMLATFCGIAYFGILGVVYGPIIMILITTTVNFYIDSKTKKQLPPKET